MGKPVNIASTSHAQQAEMAALLGGRGMTAEPAPTDSELLDRIEALQTANSDLTAQLEAEREAHAKTQAALAAATSAPTGE